jgi:hypothetical protein
MPLTGKSLERAFARSDAERLIPFDTFNVFYRDELDTPVRLE